MVFEDRQEAGKRLAGKLRKYRNSEAIVVALPRGGVVVGFEIAKILNLPFDILIVRKIGAPFNSEYGIGAVGEGDVLYLDENTVDRFGVTESQINQIAVQEKQELKRREEEYRRNTQPLSLHKKFVILTDDG